MSAEFQQRFIWQNGLRYAVTVSGGTGTPLLLLHGFTGSAASWGDRLARFAADRPVIAPDLIGHGATDTPTDPARAAIDRAAADLIGLCDQLGVERVHLLGYSMGGRLALYTALTYPQRVVALTLESASPGVADAAEREQRRASDHVLADGIMRDGIAAFVDNWEALPLFASQQRLPAAVRERVRAERLRRDPAGLAVSLRGMGTGAQPPLWDRLPALTLPVQLIVGADDHKFVRIAEQMRDRLPDAALVRVNGAGHTVHLEQPERFYDAVSAFARSHASGNQSSIR